jgi:RNA polymerase sigma-70 factor (ECF subfamily)
VFEADRQLVARLLDGEQPAFRDFYDKYAYKMAAFVMRRSGSNRAAAEDIVQSAMVRALRALSQYRGEASLLTWLCQICRNELADQRRKSARRPILVSMDSDVAVAAKVAAMPSVTKFDFDAQATDRTLADSVANAMRQLPEHYVRVLELKYGDDLSVEQISLELALSFSATQSLLVRAREAFRSVCRDERIEGMTTAGPATDHG